VIDYLARVKEDQLASLDLFRHDETSDQALTADAAVFNRYRVNLLVDNGKNRGAPVLFEENPTYHNLIGQVEHQAHMGTLTTDFTLIRAGALHRANGGFLVLDVEKVLASPYAWKALKRSLRSGEVRIESLERQLSLAGTISLEPQPVPIDLKLILIGDRQTYYLLREYDPEFERLFKVVADFSEEMPRDDLGEEAYARLIATLIREQRLHHLERAAVARIIEESARRAWDGERLSLHLEWLIDLLRESQYHATRNHCQQIAQAHVEQALHSQEYRGDQWREQVQEQILRGTVKIETSGIQLAQVNGLTVVQFGDHAFGAPARISATARLGGGEVVDISRETNQGGPIHSKGVMILASYLAERYAKHQPLSLSASLVFEQTYAMVEGDSASAAELCALLSALGDIPIRQPLAITGSINQRGEIQAIGGVCQKIEGYFDICAARGLDGSHGVIIPQSNQKDLMLRPRVREAAAKGLFHIYAVFHVEQAMELLTGLEAGRRNAEGIYPEASINGRIQLRLAEWIGLRQYFGGQLQAEVQVEDSGDGSEPASTQASHHREKKAKRDL
jgi:lon-related putative ATP-dependent protease